MIKQAIILAGGLGTRLRSVVSDVPKCMALVNGRPFLHYLIQLLEKNGIEDFIFSLGYLNELIETYLRENYSSLSYSISLETEPLGTGGAIRLACSTMSEQNVLVCNGDTFFKIDVDLLDKFHKEKNAECTLCLKPMENFDRYGVVELNTDQSVKSFKEKDFYTKGLINGGVYVLDVSRFLKNELPEKFSFEKEYLEKNVQSDKSKSRLFGLIQDAYFIDIGIPEDYNKAQKDFVSI